MPVLTRKEAEVLEAVRRQCRQGDPVAAWVVKAHVQGQGVSYDSADRALRSLIKQGLITKPSRGFYLPACPDA